MNYNKKLYESNRLRNLIRASNRCGSHEGCLRVHAHNTIEHEIGKLIIMKKLLNLGYSVWSEAIFLNGSRADIVGIKDGEGVIVEVLHSEIDKVKKLASNPKEGYYPTDFSFYQVESDKVKEFEI